ncbi:MAG: arsenate reductase ArsC [Acidobacteria bacterium]|nr:MAG: arsenate reductase ArsC [Acidobacteriota bacterium]REK08757.1 MAG: arsenate reductase ArsC [Acidobacteriota bacterium]
MAEAVLQQRGGDLLEVASAGSRPTGFVHPLAIQVMAEIGFDIADRRSKSLDEFRDQPLDTVITVCDDADRDCPFVAGDVVRLHWGFPDPAAAAGDDQQVLEEFRRVRDAIVRTCDAFVADLR